ncbi:MAG: zinc-binding dehydrogenase, partial [Gammaproteobacteria bacterium]|nr:zinc-binding dehydrogenase [Gammaproteobacteria bacterium]
MSTTINRRITLAARPRGAPKPDDFTTVDDAVPGPGEGEMLLRTVYLSLDPYMRGRMNDARSYVPPVRLGDTMEGGAVSVVEASRHPKFSAGDIVFGYTGWQRYAISNGKGMRTVDPSIAPISTALGILGMPGLTGYVGLLDLGQPKEGETVVVSAATGAVGSLVGQIAKLKGCRVVGVAGAEAKCRYAVDTLGLDACVSHHDADLAAALKEACPDGIDIY